MSQRRYVLSREAANDIRQIARFTFREWGAEQSKAYRDRLTAALEKLAAFPKLGRHRAELRLGVRSFAVQRHIVFYREAANGDATEIVRILHERMNPATHV